MKESKVLYGVGVMGQKQHLTHQSDRFVTQEVGPYILSRNKTLIPAIDHSPERPEHMEPRPHHQIDEEELYEPVMNRNIHLIENSKIDDQDFIVENLLKNTYGT